MNIPYYPGCTLYTKAKPLNTSMHASFKALDVELLESPHWYCCGTTFTLARDNRMSLIAPLRILAKARQEGEQVIVPCSVCFNTLKRAQYILKQEKDVLTIINEHLEESYDTSLKIVHPLEYFRDNKDQIKAKVKKELKGMKIGCYYGCLLLRPYKEMQFDDPESPSIFEDFISNLGATAIDFPMKVECCGSYLLLNSLDAVIEASYKIIRNARGNGAEALITSCPMCHYNLDALQSRIKKAHPEFNEMPVFYFTQLSALALGVDEKDLGLQQNKVPPHSLLKEYGLL
ncbi:CoB--CoM heterodisulfide reductase iron-sulfur subunit B family protein [candidate division WOR-3 bacterium]|nr:CoB--CoM heterodisulfide reductase iron-sulfur subunit B family protein [candidate division WOR-3 bacterium]